MSPPVNHSSSGLRSAAASDLLIRWSCPLNCTRFHASTSPNGPFPIDAPKQTHAGSPRGSSRGRPCRYRSTPARGRESRPSGGAAPGRRSGRRYGQRGHRRSWLRSAIEGARRKPRRRTKWPSFLMTIIRRGKALFLRHSKTVPTSQSRECECQPLKSTNNDLRPHPNIYVGYVGYSKSRPIAIAAGAGREYANEIINPQCSPEHGTTIPTETFRRSHRAGQASR